MALTVVTTATVREDHTVTFTLPADVPLGEVRIVATVEPSSAPRKMTGKELAESEFFGDLKGVEGWPDGPEEFREWRRRLWGRPQE